jgi:hypothetical protein
MCSAIPPAPPPVAPPPQASAPVVLSVVADKGAAEALAKLQAGAVLAATVAAAEGKGVVRVMTADGSSLSLRLPPGQTLPPDGAQLAMQYISQNGLPAFKLLSINGRPTGAAPLPPPQGGLANPPDLAAMLGSGAKAASTQVSSPAMGPGGAPAVTSPGLAAGPVGLTATIIRSGPPGAVMLPADAGTPGLEMTEPLPASLSGLAPGTRLTVRIAAMAPPGQGAVGGGQLVPNATAQGSAAAQTAPPLQAGQTVLPQTPLPASVAGAAFPPQSTPLSPPASGLPPAVSTPSAPTLAAQAPVSQPQAQPVTLPGLVVAQPAGGAALVQSPAGMLSLNVASPLPVGGVLRLEVIDRPQPPPPISPAPSPPQGLTPDGWPSLDQAVDTLLQTDRQAAQQLMRMIPQAGPHLAAAMSQFAGAVRSGDARPLLSDPVVKGLEKAGRKDLAERLKKEFLDLAEDASRPMGRGDWQAITLPFAHGANIDAIDLYIHRPPNDEEKGAKGSEQRFILDVRMSVLGRIQLDGLVQKDLKRFDLIVRSAEPLSAAMCRDIAGIFAECGQMTGIKGQVSFQAGRAFVDLLPAAAPATQIVV